MREPTEFEESEYLAEIEGERGRRRPAPRRMVQRQGVRPGLRSNVRFARPATRRQMFQRQQLRPGMFRPAFQFNPGAFRQGAQLRPGIFRPDRPFRRPGRRFPFPRDRRFWRPDRWPNYFPPGFPPDPRSDSQDQGPRSSSFGSGSASASASQGYQSPQASEHTRWVQSSLNRILGLNLPVNGLMDDQTRSAVRDFQTKKGLPADGIVGPPTERAIVEASSAGPSTPPEGANGKEPPPAATGQEPPPAANGQEELFEFFPELEFPNNEMSLESEFENWHNELHRGESNGCGCHAKSNSPRLTPELETLFETEEENGGAGKPRLTLGVAGDSRIIDLTAKANKSRRLRIRPPEKVHALVLHQMACCYKVKDPLTRFLNMAPHFAILPDGRILQLHPLQAYTAASNGFNAGSVAVEFAGNFPNTKGKWWMSKDLKTDAQRKANQNQVTPQQIESGRYLVQYLKRTMGLKTILAHRQSSGTRENDPGPDIWYNVGQWAVDNLGLSDGGPGFKVGTGNPLPDLWRKWGQAKPQP